MHATETPMGTGDRTHIDITPGEFERRLAAHGHDSDEIRHLWSELAETESGAPSSTRLLGFGPVIAVYLGLLLVVAASASLLALYWHDLGTWGVLALGAVYLAGYLAASEILRRRDLTQPADVLEAVSVAWVGITTYAVLELASLWPEGASDLGRIHVGLTTIAVVCIAATLLLLALRPDPLLVVPLAAASALLAADLAEFVFGQKIDDLSSRQVTVFVLPLGLAWIATGLWLDVARKREFATWTHWVGLALTGIAVVSMVPRTVPGFAVIGVLGAFALFFSAFARHWSFTVVGALGVLLATVSSMNMLGRIAPLVIAVVGIALIFVGLRWSRWRESIRVAVLARMPATARNFVTRLSP
jgi:hypothetical protein